MAKYITLDEVVKSYLGNRNDTQPVITEDAEFEIIDNRNCVFDSKEIEKRLIELGALEEAEFKVVNNTK
jgi:hypothetical protein